MGAEGKGGVPGVAPDGAAKGIALRAASRVIDRRRVTPRSGWNPRAGRQSRPPLPCPQRRGRGIYGRDVASRMLKQPDKHLGARLPGQVHVRRAAVPFGLCYSLPGVRRQPSRCTAGREPSYSPLSSRAFVLHRAGRVRKAARGRLPCIATGPASDGCSAPGRDGSRRRTGSAWLSRPGGISPIPCCSVAKIFTQPSLLQRGQILHPSILAVAWPNSFAILFWTEEPCFPCDSRAPSGRRWRQSLFLQPNSVLGSWGMGAEVGQKLGWRKLVCSRDLAGPGFRGGFRRGVARRPARTAPETCLGLF